MSALIFSVFVFPKDNREYSFSIFLLRQLMLRRHERWIRVKICFLFSFFALVGFWAFSSIQDDNNIHLSGCNNLKPLHKFDIFFLT